MKELKNMVEELMQEKEVLKKINYYIEQMISGKLEYEPSLLEEFKEEDIENEEVKKLYQSFKNFFQLFTESQEFINLLAEGNLNIEAPPRNYLISPFKQLQGNLRHLLWLTKEITKGDYKQNVSFLGDFSVAFNAMIKSLKEKDEKIDQEKVKLKKAKEEIEEKNSQLRKKNQMLTNINLLLEEKTFRDSLTNLYNHQYINKILEIEVEKAKLTGQKFSVMMLDLDYFKKVNDNFGHQVGDEVLAFLADVLRKNVRKSDIIGRYGGEEFTIILPGASVKQAKEIAERIRSFVEKATFANKELKLTISIGVVEYDGGNAKTILNKADDLLYKAKNNGRNRVEG